jgi:uncharacterized protein YcgI (DUF1989 family)
MQRIDIPAREGRGVRLSAGARFRAIDVEGRQCGDLFAFSADNVREYTSSEHTRVHTGRIFPKVGQHFYTNRRRPILAFEEDHTPGKHDMFVAACDPTRYAELGVKGWHASCQENLQKVMAGFGFDSVQIPSPINIFTNIPLASDGTLSWQPAVTEPGDYITLQAAMDCYVVVAACAQDVTPINDKQPSGLAIELLD